MRSRTLYRELTAAGILIASYPLGWIAERAALRRRGQGQAVILLHGLGGNRANLLGLAAYLRMAGFGNILFFEYPRTQAISRSAEHLGELVNEVGGALGVHLVGHSLGGTIARRFSGSARPAVRSLVTLGSPYRYDQQSPIEVALFGDEDPLVPPPLPGHLRPGAVKRAVVLPSTGHLGVLYHAETLRIIESELSSNSARDAWGLN